MKLSDWIKSFEIFARYFPGGYKENYCFSAEHDIIFVHLTTDQIPVDSKDGKALDKLGWHIEDDVSWARYV